MEEARSFLADTAPDKREKLIDRLLEHPFYGDFWANKWADLLRPNPDRAGIKSVYVLDQWIREAFKAVPRERTPTAADWTRLSSAWKLELDRRIERLTHLRDHLTGCIGCGCLSVRDCPLRNPWDRLAEEGTGARLLDPD